MSRAVKISKLKLKYISQISDLAIKIKELERAKEQLFSVQNSLKLLEINPDAVLEYEDWINGLEADFDEKIKSKKVSKNEQLVC